MGRICDFGPVSFVSRAWFRSREVPKTLKHTPVPADPGCVCVGTSTYCSTLHGQWFCVHVDLSFPGIVTVSGHRVSSFIFNYVGPLTHFSQKPNRSLFINIHIHGPGGEHRSFEAFWGQLCQLLRLLFDIHSTDSQHDGATDQFAPILSMVLSQPHGTVRN
jgi:hypothetical protein